MASIGQYVSQFLNRPAAPPTDSPPVNQMMPPWATTAHSAGILSELEHPNLHAVIQHPNVSHYERGAASPFVESDHVANAIRGRARQAAPFINNGSGGLARVMRK